MSHRALSPEQFQFIQASEDNPEASRKYHQLRHPDERKAALAWHKGTGVIMSIRVPPHLQRQGIATAMWHRAHAISAENPEVVPPRHSRVRSEMGDKWARAVGGELPKTTSFVDLSDE